MSVCSVDFKQKQTRALQNKKVKKVQNKGVVVGARGEMGLSIGPASSVIFDLDLC